MSGFLNQLGKSFVYILLISDSCEFLAQPTTPPTTLSLPSLLIHSVKSWVRFVHTSSQKLYRPQAPSTRIRFVSGHLKGLVNRACAKRLVLILWRQRIQKYTDTSVHTYPDTQRIQKFPLWRAYTEISGYTERIRRTRVDARCIRSLK